MALSADDWYAKISKFVPSWYFEKKDQPENLTIAVYKAIGAVFAQIQGDTDSAQAATFILQSEAPVLDLLGDERNVERSSGELDAKYAVRVQTALFVPVGKTQLEAFVNAVLHNGTGFFIENMQYGFWDDADISETPGIPYADDIDSRWLDLTKNYNWWTVIIPVQTGGVDADIQAAIISAIEDNKALGTTYDVLYGSSSDTDTDD